MKAIGSVTRLIDRSADLLAWIARRVRKVCKPGVRLWRLVSLRAQVGGQIPVSTQFDGAVSASGGGNVWIGEHCRLGRNVHFDTADGGQITIGAHVRINAGSVIAAAVSVSIGDDTLIGEYVSIRDANHGIAAGVSIRSQPLDSAPIRIGRDVWIGRGCCILKGVTIGDGAVVGADSVVCRDVAPASVHVGSPARQIRIRSEGIVVVKSSAARGQGS